MSWYTSSTCHLRSAQKDQDAVPRSIDKTYQTTEPIHRLYQNGLPIGLLGLLGTGLEKTPMGGKPLVCLPFDA